MNFYKNLKAQTRLGIAFAVMLLFTLGTGYLAISGLYNAHEEMAMAVDDTKTLVALQNIIIAKNDKSAKDRDALLNFDDAAVVEKDIAAAQADLTTMKDQVGAVKPFMYSDQTRALFAQIEEAFAPYQVGYEKQMVALRAHDLAGAKEAQRDMNEVAARLLSATTQLRDIKLKKSEGRVEQSSVAYISARNITIAVLSVALVLGTLLALFIARSFAVPLKKSVEALKRVADGDLTAQLDVNTRDEVGQMAAELNGAVQRLRQTMQQVALSAGETTSSSKQLAAASEAIASGAQEQAASLEETSASLEEITATVRSSADNAKQASHVAAESTRSAVQGKEVVAKAIAAMTEIDASSKKISDIISTIDEIAFQTNLLAVNAAVEAARAGDEGRGFAVVAGEVRSLAQRSSEAAKEIKSLIQDSVRKVEVGSALVNQSGQTLTGMFTSSQKVNDIVGDIAAAASEQSLGIEQVNKAMTQMDQVTQSNSAQTEELSATAASLSDQAANLQQLISRFRLGDDANTDSRRSAQRGGAVRDRRAEHGREPAFGAPTPKVQFARRAALHPALMPAIADYAVSPDDFEEF